MVQPPYHITMNSTNSTTKCYTQLKLVICYPKGKSSYEKGKTRIFKQANLKGLVAQITLFKHISCRRQHFPQRTQKKLTQKLILLTTLDTTSNGICKILNIISCMLRGYTSYVQINFRWLVHST